MWRFKPSKFKNAAPKVSPRQEGWVTDITIATPNSCGNHINASAAFVAFNIDSGGGGSLGVVPTDEFGSQRNKLCQLNAHSDVIMDFDFCPYDDGILATGSVDHHVKIWRIRPEMSMSFNSVCNLLLENGVEVLKFHPLTDCMLSTADDKHIRLWDVTKQKEIYGSSHDSTVQGLSWKGDGQLLASIGKDKYLNIWDSRQPTKSQKTLNHANNRDGRVLWLGDSSQILTTGFGNGRERELFIRDVKKLNDPLFTFTGESSLGVWIPLFDPDTNMIFLVAKADTAVSFCEIMEKEPFFQEASKYMGNIQAKGAALVPKRALNVMQGEVNRVLLLGANCVVPVSYVVPRKSYRDFHADLFPETRSPYPTMTVSQWITGENVESSTVSLDPADKVPLLNLSHALGQGPALKQMAQQRQKYEPVPVPPSTVEETDDNILSELVKQTEPLNVDIVLSAPVSEVPEKPVIALKPASPRMPVKSEILSQASPNSQDNVSSANSSGDTKKNLPKPRQAPARTFGIRSSKFRHLNGTVLQNKTSVTDINGLTRTVPGESDGFKANDEFIALPLGAGGNLIAILQVSMCGRAPSLADVPGVVCGSKCTDFAWDPFDNHRLVTACDTGDIQVWNIDAGFSEKISEPQSTLRTRVDKVSIIKFHPCAKDIVCSAGSDMCLRIWNLATLEESFCLTGHQDQVLALSWSPDGECIATVSKDLKVRVYNPRMQSTPLREGTGPEGIRGARIVWVLNGTHFVVSGFNKVSERQVYLYDNEYLSSPLGNFGLDVSPATLIPHYDEDSSTLFLTGKGDATVYAFEVATDSPYLHPLSHYKCSGPHQALSFLPKFVCDVKEVEFARAVRLTTSSIETLSFYVPRLRTEFFQDDLFPDTRITWESTLTSKEWLSGKNVPSQFKSLRPPDMPLLSTAPPPVKNVSSNKSAEQVPIANEGLYFESSLAFLQSNKEKEEMIIQSMMSQCQFQQTSLPQDSFDGVDPKEWDEEEELHAQQNQ